MTTAGSQPRTPGADRLRRSMHFVPGANRKMLDKALASAADSLILDLEDAVTPEHKGSARETVADWLATVDFGRQERCVRMNPLDSPWGEDDLRATMRHPPDVYVVPKVSSRAELDRIDALLSDLEVEHGHPPRQVGLMLVATETPLAVLNLPELPGCPRVIGLTWGAEDLSAALGGSRNRDDAGRLLDVYRHCRVQTLLAAAAAGVQPLDSVFVDIRDSDGLQRECEEASWMGYRARSPFIRRRSTWSTPPSAPRQKRSMKPAGWSPPSPTPRPRAAWPSPSRARWSTCRICDGRRRSCGGPSTSRRRGPPEAQRRAMLPSSTR